jgi:glutaredoxin
MSDFIKNKIYKDKIVIFGAKDCKFTDKAIKLFTDNYNHTPEAIYIDNNKLKTCLINKTKDNITPKIFINGMYAGNYSQLEMKHERNDLNIIFKGL